ncbi:hypothetical protein [Pseudomonas aeruginosa]|uniref:hypothetical protein n=1 Tax=Pseudomonas aeruginosa TaxID=287 RepID=UPI001365C8AD|nr:hypothetical protein [Pseudomonas aeruginosa]
MTPYTNTTTRKAIKRMKGSLTKRGATPSNRWPTSCWKSRSAERCSSTTGAKRPRLRLRKAEIIKHLYANLPSGLFGVEEINLKTSVVFAHIYTAGAGEGAPVYH